MTDASKTTYATKSPFSVSNDDVYEALHRMGGHGTAEDVIVYFYGNDLVSVTEGKRRAQPIYRALSELAKAGRLDDSDQVLNAETNAKNTAYRIPNRPIKAKVGNSYKARYEASLEENKKLRERIEFLVTKNENLVDKLASFLLKPGH